MAACGGPRTHISLTTPYTSIRQKSRAATKLTGRTAALAVFLVITAPHLPINHRAVGSSPRSSRSTSTTSGRITHTMARQPSMPGTRETVTIQLAGRTGVGICRAATGAARPANIPAATARVRSAKMPTVHIAVLRLLLHSCPLPEAASELPGRGQNARPALVSRMAELAPKPGTI